MENRPVYFSTEKGALYFFEEKRALCFFEESRTRDARRVGDEVVLLDVSLTHAKTASLCCGPNFI